MMNDSPTRPVRRMTPDEVLAVLAYQHRIEVIKDSNTVIRHDMTIEKWHDALLIEFDFRSLADGFNEWFDTTFTDEQWESALSPHRTKTLRGMCELIATQAVVPAIEPVSILGKPCLSAGAFVTLRRLLLEAGEDVTNVHPSGPIEPCLRRSLKFRGDLVKLTAGKLPFMKLHFPPYEACTWMSLVGVAGTIGGAILTADGTSWGSYVLFASVTILVGTYIMDTVVAKRPPSTARVGTLRTFRDLSYAIAGETPKGRAKKPA